MLLAATVFLVTFGFVTGAAQRVRGRAAVWSAPEEAPAYRIVVPPGNAVVRRGDPIYLTAYLEPTCERAELPRSLVLVVRVSGSTDEAKSPMSVDGEGVFTASRANVVEDFEYCIEAGGERSVWYSILVADPIGTTSETTVSIHPPAYASDAVEIGVRRGFGEIALQQFARVSLDLRFGRPTADAALEYRPSKASSAERRSISLRIAADRTAATGEFLADEDGTLVLTLSGERGFREEHTASVRVLVDAPPRFERVSGLSASLRELRPGGRIALEIALSDDYRIADLTLEFCVDGNEFAMRSVPIPLPGLGEGNLEGSFEFDTTGKVREGEVLFVRLKARDSRSVPAAKIDPQVRYYPAGRWAQFRIAASARSLDEQEVFGDRDRVKTTLQTANNCLLEALNEIAVIRADKDEGPLRADLAVRTRIARDRAAEARKLLGELAAELAITPDLRGLLAPLRTVSDRTLAAADANLGRALNEPAHLKRAPDFVSAAETLQAAIELMTFDLFRNEQIASARIARNGLRRLAEEQKALGSNAGTPEERLRIQKEILHRSNVLTSENELLKRAADAAAQNELHSLAKRTRTLAANWDSLEKATFATDELARHQRTADLARRQNDLVAEAGRLATTTDAAARIAGTTPLDRQPIEKANERLATGQPLESLADQERAAREFDRLADGLGRAAEGRGDFQQAARQFSRWQDDLRRRHADAARPNPEGLPTEAQRRAFAAEQRSILSVVELLRTGGAVDPALVDLASAASALEGSVDASGPLNRAAESLSKLADKMPANDHRIREAKRLLEAIRKEQDAISQSAEDVVRGVDPRNQPDAAHAQMARKLGDLAAKAGDLGARLRRLDVPGHELRLQAVVATAGRARADLLNALPMDVEVSQRDVRRQLDRLRQALDGLPTPDAQSVDASRFLTVVARSVTALPLQPSTEEVRPVQTLLREVQNLLAKLAAPDAAGPLADLQEACSILDAALRNLEESSALRSKADSAVAASDRLANRLAGFDSDSANLFRIAAKRADLAEKSASAAKQPSTPESAAVAQRQVRKHLDELDAIRVGVAQAAKKRACEALERLKAAKDADRQTALQKAAAAELKALANEVQRNRDREIAPALVGPPLPTVADALRAAVGLLPTANDAEWARDLARRQRALRDATSEVGIDLANGAKPAADDELGKLLAVQESLAVAIRSHFSKHPSVDDAIEQAVALSASSLRNGATATAAKAGAIAVERLRLAASPDRITFTDRQSELNAGIEALRDRPDAEAARQQRRREELAAEAGSLSEALRTAALVRAADAMEAARERLARKGRDPAVRTAIREILERAAKHADEAARTAPSPPAASEGELALGHAMRAAEQSLHDGIRRVGEKDVLLASSRNLLRAAEAAAELLREGSDRSSELGRPPLPIP